MDARAIAKCEIRLNAAAKALEDLRAWKSFDEFDTAWFVFLSAWKAVYTTLEQGVKGDPKATQWFGLRNKTRRADELLQYLYQARNDDTHGLEEQAQKTSGGLAFGRPLDSSKPMIIKNMTISTGPAGPSITYDATSENFDPHFEIIAAKVSLLPVRDRDKQSGKVYPPPTSHLGNPLKDDSPVYIAELGLAYVRSMVEDAKSLV
jgi:hypothetical protein